MHFTQCKLRIKKRWSCKNHPLHILTNKIKWMTQHGRSDSPLIISLSYEKKQDANIFVVVHLDDYSDVEQKSSNHSESVGNQPQIMFWCNSEFLDHYKLDISEQFTFCVVKVFPLAKVTIAALTEETYIWATQKVFETGLLVSTTCNGQIMVRFNDCFLASPGQSFGSNPSEIISRFKEMIVIGCDPIQQGLINFKTQVVVVKPQNQHLAIKNNQENSSIDVKNLNIKVIDNNVNSYQSMNTIYISCIICKQHDIKDGEYVEVKIANQNTAFELQKTSVCQVSIISETDDFTLKLSSTNANTVCVNSNTWFNLVGDQHLMKENLNWICQVSKLNVEPEYSSEIHLSLILSPLYPPDSCFDKSLLKFFSSTQIVKQGDVISINVSADCDFHETADFKTSRCRTLYYKVSHLSKNADPNQAYLIDTNNTAVYQVGTVHSYVPPVVCFIKPSLHTGLEKYIDNLKEIINPYLSTDGMFDHMCSVLVSGQSGCGKWSVVSKVCQSCHLHLVEVDCHTLISDTPGASEAKIKEAFRRASTFAPCILLLQDLNVLGRNQESDSVNNRVCSAFSSAISNLHEEMMNEFPVIVVASVHDEMGVVGDIRMQFLHQVDIEAPTESERRKMARNVASHLSMSTDVDYDWIAKHSAGFVYGDFWQLMKKTVVQSHSRIIENCAVGSKLSFQEEKYISMAGVMSSNDDVIKALNEMQDDRADTIGVPKIPDVQWSDIGGLEEVKTHILDTIQLPLDCPELLKSGLNRSGVLLYGPPGTGKTLLAKAVASQCSLSFLSVKGPELINMYVGQSEENVRKVFQKARDAAPCVVFFDELDALAPNRGKSGDSGGVMDRVVSQLLAELDGVNSSEDKDKLVFIIAASNRPDLIDTALLRPGRLDKLLYVGISENRLDQLKVLTAQTRKLNLAHTVCLDQVVENCPSNMTGADFYALTSDAAMNAVRRHIKKLESLDTESMDKCFIEQADFLKAASNVVPSVNAAQLENYRQVKSKLDR